MGVAAMRPMPVSMRQCRLDAAARCSTSWASAVPTIATHSRRSVATTAGVATPATSSSAIPGPEVAHPGSRSFLEVRRTAREDVKSLLRNHKADWVQRADFLATVALDLFPKDALHWRVAGPMLMPDAQMSAKAIVEAVQAELAGGTPRLRRAQAGASPSAASETAKRIQACCFSGILTDGSSRSSAQAKQLLMAFLDEGSDPLGRTFVQKASLQDLSDSFVALSQVQWALPSKLQDFTKAMAVRLASDARKLPMDHLQQVLEAMDGSVQYEKQVTAVRAELNKRLEDWVRGKASAGTLGTVSVVAGARLAKKEPMLSSRPLREALLPDKLELAVAAKLLRFAVSPTPGSGDTTDFYLIGLLSKQIATGMQKLKAQDLESVLQGVLALQASSSIPHREHAGELLQALWAKEMPAKWRFLSSQGRSALLQAYWWQLLYSMQSSMTIGVARSHPLTRTPGQVASETERLKSEVLWPIMSNLGEMSLNDIRAVLTILAPPMFPPDVLTARDGEQLQSYVEAAFPSQGDLQESDQVEWWRDTWSAELASLSAAELLELACGLREAKYRGASAAQGAVARTGREDLWWVLRDVLTELQRRLSVRTPSRDSDGVQLSHTLLVRACRCADIFDKHEVESLLKELLASPANIQALPTGHYIAMLKALCSWRVPQALPLTLTSALLDDVDRGSRSADPAMWSELLSALAPLGNPFSDGQRGVARIAQLIVPHLGELPATSLAAVLASLSRAGLQSGTADASSASYLVFSRAPLAATAAVQRVIEAEQCDFHLLMGLVISLGKLDWYSEAFAKAFLRQAMRTQLLEGHSRSLVPLAGALVELRMHHAPLLNKIVHWYTWCCKYLWPKPLSKEDVDEALALGRHLHDLSFQSLAFLDVLAENLENPNATPSQLLMLLSLLARFSHFPPSFRSTCARVCKEDAGSSDLASLRPSELVEAFNIHLCAVFDGPAALKLWLTEDEAMKSFFQVHTSQKWYQEKDQERAGFLQSSTFPELSQAMQDAGLDVRPSDLGEVYHVEFVSPDAKERLSGNSGSPPLAIVCIKSKEQLRWYVPITAEVLPDEEQLTNRCNTFKLVFSEAVQKLRHLQAMGYKTVPIWMTEWKMLKTREERAEHIRDAVSAPTRLAFSPSSQVAAYE